MTGSTTKTQRTKPGSSGSRTEPLCRTPINHALLAWVPRVMFVLLPLFAWLVALAYRRIDRNYLHHLIFAVHVHAAWFAVAAIAKAVELVSPPIGQALLQICVSSCRWCMRF